MLGYDKRKEDNCINGSDEDTDPELIDDMESNNMAACSDKDLDFRPEDFIPSDSGSSVIESTLSFELPATIIPLADYTNKRNRTEQQAILHACRKQTCDESERNKTIFIVDNLLLRPFAILDEKGNEENVLAHDDVVKRLTSKHSSIQPIVPMKRQYQQDNSSSDNTLCAKCIPKAHIDLEKLLATSPYVSLLSQREYIPLKDEMCELMNRDWRHNAQDVVHTTSLSPPLKAIHPDVWPVSLSRNDGPKLVIGTQVSNALVTSSIRLDQKLLPSVGGITTSFNMTVTDSFASKIFIGVESATAAKTIISNPATKCVLNTGMLSHQLRQIRTRFDLPNTYILVRASGP
ncbi:hypothetical protein G6F46_010336 [Rhizopus delemar]|uniref:Uncharacterized protein n=2 Tax=Rhizopus TaxID=4842 RepID=A0A9P7CJU6_9FUNG|nr:hypothetical protein G6F55_007216 [Rhizopus delemar]KAG1537272.1 hypothetical protein G6F51_010468 [Rhizopus arrhizus]KAG1491383.1 hypothetical protein G6F54_010058 [Rhizopus delemar]KAG1506214.1 hypothetical protein G6F53_009856 [Rhizopus delemar]KAG1519192.1 hypothetical protein G6F52_008859 [Rhizopus delemar]